MEPKEIKGEAIVAYSRVEFNHLATVERKRGNLVTPRSIRPTRILAVCFQETNEERYRLVWTVTVWQRPQTNISSEWSEITLLFRELWFQVSAQNPAKHFVAIIILSGKWQAVMQDTPLPKFSTVFRIHLSLFTLFTTLVDVIDPELLTDSLNKM
jgi:hypothetical protein